VDFLRGTDNRLYYGVSISAWRKFFKRHGYTFVCVESNGVNAFFVNPRAFNKTFLRQLQGLSFSENTQQLQKCGGGWEVQFETMKGMEFFDIR